MGGTSSTLQLNVSAVAAPLSSVAVTVTRALPGVASVAIVPVMRPVAGSMDRPRGRLDAPNVSGSPLGSENALDASTGVMVWPSVDTWPAVGAPTTGAWFVAVRRKVLVALPPSPSVAVTATV